MAASATSSVLRNSLHRTGISKMSSLHLSQAIQPMAHLKPMPLAALCPLVRPTALQTRLFHGSSPRQLLPAGPQKIEGGVNDPVRIPDPNPLHGSYHWDFERLVSLGLIPLTVAPFVSGSLNPTMDAILCSTLLIHSHIGFQAIIIDYIPNWRMPGIRKLFWWGLRLGTVLVGVGLYEFETNDVGLTETIKRVWKA